ncbi:MULTISPECIES: hypothetical protein [Aliivibrio]|uniref:Lipoprotein n=1 Tax=Aliivibrio finisterrensis TaxID=511998 RepID=A0A4Q5KU16_9GAMM|nr:MULTISPECIES: hypothetical protein [Aliivibrio]MDD9179350.1 hypothetical protein [Aliivibrio sp. A6]RYU51384.1 hypothetical protein ERW57_09710 [Aliivibrio finisterrensis]RYU52564.1 hypothetical protein ERW56_10050 [Aliivibrio finisterrensis]RYU58094.1 hypothetical protein ERW50_09475 [Aliivibrio finisterrensis]RYU64582.1 hypothetical protein ERW53_09230 [Aliivibrio finisterrensis]
MKNKILVVIASLFLMACSDSGGSGSSGSTGGGGASPATVPQPEPVKTQDLVAPDGFTFNPVTAHTLEINLSGSLPERTHLSVYSAYTEGTDGKYIVDYDSKVIDAALVNGALTIEFSLAESQSTIVAEIWSYDGSLPIQKEFAIDSNPLVWD